MRKIQLTTNEQINERETLISALTLAPAEGYTLADQRAGLAVIDKLEQCVDGVLSLKETEWTWLKARLNRQVWGRLSHNIIALVDKVSEAPDEKEEGSE